MEDEGNKTEFLAVWEELYNPNLNRVQFEAVKNKAGLNRFVMTPTKWIEQISFTYASEADWLNVALFGKTANQWREENADKKGNIRDYATPNQLLVHANMESYNAIVIEQGKSQSLHIYKIAEIERENIRVQTMEGHIQKVREGKWNGGFAPYGYQLIDGKLQINEMISWQKRNMLL